MREIKLSVILITHNEASNIVACLASVAFANEWIVVDSGSTDNTVELARANGARVVQTSDWPGFGPQKNRALALAQGEWVLSIDADERVTPELAKEIEEMLALTTGGTGSQTTAVNGYEIARLSNFCGRLIRHSGWWPDYGLRLFRRNAAHFSDVAIHEKVVLKVGKKGRLKGYFLHYPYRNIEGLIKKINGYSSDAAAMMYAQGQRSGIWRALGHGFWTFVRIYLLRRGFLDGRHGVVLAVAAAGGSFLRYIKLMFLVENARRNGVLPR